MRFGERSSPRNERSWPRSERISRGAAGSAALAVAIGVGAVLPNLATGAAWPYVVIGVAFSLLGIAFFAYGLRRVRVVRSAIQRGVPADPDDRVVIAVTSVRVALGFLTIAILLYQL
ncbi:MAG TPA: hypothetical protein VFK76_06385 [Gaiellaceae bacterium]|nr:hypothetical protein [Gaiellaceae bacterium]